MSEGAGGFYFHPSDQDQPPGTPVIKKPLECVLSVYSNSETAVVWRGVENDSTLNDESRRRIGIAAEVGFDCQSSPTLSVLLRRFELCLCFGD